MLDIEVAILVLFVFSPIIVAILYEVVKCFSWFWRPRRDER